MLLLLFRFTYLIKAGSTVLDHWCLQVGTWKTCLRSTKDKFKRQFGKHALTGKGPRETATIRSLVLSFCHLFRKDIPSNLAISVSERNCFLPEAVFSGSWKHWYGWIQEWGGSYLHFGTRVWHFRVCPWRLHEFAIKLFEEWFTFGGQEICIVCSRRFPLSY